VGPSVQVISLNYNNIFKSGPSVQTISTLFPYFLKVGPSVGGPSVGRT
jgi:hypothetical protein